MAGVHIFIYNFGRFESNPSSLEEDLFLFNDGPLSSSIAMVLPDIVEYSLWEAFKLYKVLLNRYSCAYKLNLNLKIQFHSPKDHQDLVLIREF